jgi:DnaK suppressor protein
MAERTKTKRRAAPAAETTSTASGGSKAAGTKTSATKPAATRSRSSKPAASKSAKSSASKSGGATAAKKPTATKPARSAAETERIRAALAARRDELREEYDVHLAEIAELQRDRLTDSAGDDQADTGSKTFEREQEISLAHSILERTTQVERALERLDEGSYGWCERCGNAIPVERLAAFPSATLCVSCKQLEERR